MGPIVRASLNLRTSSFDWAHQSRHPPLLPDDGDIPVSETSCIFKHHQTMDNVHEVCHLNYIVIYALLNKTYI
jgi:hypothetical protein